MYTKIFVNAMIPLLFDLKYMENRSCYLIKYMDNCPIYLKIDNIDMTFDTVANMLTDLILNKSVHSSQYGE